MKCETSHTVWGIGLFTYTLTEWVVPNRRMPTLSLTAILVEDSQTIRDTLVPALEELGNMRVVACANTAAQARQALLEWEGRWQLIVVDLFLAAGSGLDVLAAVKTRTPGQYAFVLSNYATAEMRRRCIELGADGVFDKSTEIDAFMDRCLAIERPPGANASA